MKQSLVIWVLCLAFNTLMTAGSMEKTEGILNLTGHITSGSPPLKSKREITSTTDTKWILPTTAGQTLRRLQHVDTDRTTVFSELSQQNAEPGNNTDVLQNVTYNLAACAKNTYPQSIIIEGTNGHVFLQSTNESQFYKCKVTLQVPTNKIMRIRIKQCKHIYLRLKENIGDTVEYILNKNCRTGRSFYSVYSQTNKIIAVFDTLNRQSEKQNIELSFYFSAVDKSQMPSLELHYLTPHAGYLQTPGWNESAYYPPFMKSCVTLALPQNFVIFFSVLNMDIEHRGDRLLIFPGHCDSRKGRTKYHLCSSLVFKNWDKQSRRQCFPGRAFLFPDDLSVDKQKKDIHLTFYFYSGDLSQHSGFRLRFSFHPANLKPERIQPRDNMLSHNGEHIRSTDGTIWNCSVSVWPDLFDHFPCDLVSQCSESEDEARCPYTSDNCGLNKIDAGGRCYIYKRQQYISWFDSDKTCRQHGALLASLETHQEWNDVTKLLEHAVTPSTWIGLKATRRSTRKAYLNIMYKDIWQWESGSIAHYLHLGFSVKDSICGKIKEFTKSAPSMVTYSKCSSPFGYAHKAASFLCEFPSDHYHVPRPVKLPVLNRTIMSFVPLVACPTQHVTHEIFACDLESFCGKVVSTREWYNGDCNMPQGRPQPYFYCSVHGEFVPYTLVCDFREDCTDGNDEEFCVHSLCRGSMFSCGHGQCVDSGKRCDGYPDCMTNMDEVDCSYKSNVNNIVGQVKPSPFPAMVNFEGPGVFHVTALPKNDSQCPHTHFQCPGGGYCLPVYVRCNGINDCPGHEDEVWCNGYRCPGFYRCRGGDNTICVHTDHLCDGRPQCPQHDDELTCDMNCPEPCVCYGLAFSCSNTFHVSSFPQLRYLDARGSGLHQADVKQNPMLIHLGIQACSWRNLSDFMLPNLHSLDLSDNLLYHISFIHFVEMRHLQILNLAGNPICDRFFKTQRKFLLLSVVVFNFSRVQMHLLNISFLSAMMPNLKILDASHSKIQSLQGQALFHSLRVLDLKGCPASDFTPDFMKRLNALQHIAANNFKLCCSAVLPTSFKGECIAPSDEISSCDDLLKSGIYRFALSVFSVLAIMGNFSSFMYRLHSSTENTKNGFAVFVLHLCVSDFLMGVYLAIVGVADRVYAGSYVWSETAWKNSAVCSVAGFLSFLSSEVSAFLICVITLDRFLVLHFPFSQIRFRATSAHIACVIIWIMGLILAVVPLLPVTSHWGFYRQTGICIPLPVTRADFAGHNYSFCVMIVCNLVLFVLIAVGQSLIYWSVRSNAMSQQKTEAKNDGNDSVRSKEAVIARRLLSIAMTDFLCWFPIGLCGLLAANDVAIPGEVNVVMAIFVLPLNSALNPFLYTLNVILEKQRKTQELRFRKFLLAHLSKHSLNSMALN